MRTVEGLFDEIAAALLPHYFGEGWPALDECLSDMDWFPLRPGVVVVVLSAEEVLAEEPAVELEVFVRSIVAASETYARPIEDGECWDRPSVPFHLVLQSSPATMLLARARWQHAGARVDTLGP